MNAAMQLMQLQQQIAAQQMAEQQQQQAAAAAAAPAAPAKATDPQQLITMALGQGYTQEQAQQYAQQYIEAEKAQQAAAAAQNPAPPPPAAAEEKKEEKKDRVMKYEKTPLILSIEEGRRHDEHRAILKAVLVGAGGGKGR